MIAGHSSGSFVLRYCLTYSIVRCGLNQSSTVGTLLPRRRRSFRRLDVLAGPTCSSRMSSFPRTSLAADASPTHLPQSRVRKSETKKERRVGDRLRDPDPLGREADEVRRDDQDGKEHVTPPRVRVLGTRPLSARRLRLPGRDRGRSSPSARGLGTSTSPPPGPGAARSRVPRVPSAGSVGPKPRTRREGGTMRTPTRPWSHLGGRRLGAAACGDRAHCRDERPDAFREPAPTCRSRLP